MEKKCSRCGKLFNLDNKSIRSVDTDGNPLRIDLCSMCELDNAIEEVAKLKHISRKEAEKYFFDKINEAIDDIKPYNNNEILSNMDNWIKQATGKKSTTSNKINKQGFRYVGDVEPNKVVRMVKDNEICSD